MSRPKISKLLASPRGKSSVNETLTKQLFHFKELELLNESCIKSDKLT